MIAQLGSRLMKLAGGAVLVAAVAFSVTACSDGNEKGEEPIAPSTEPTIYPEDPDLAGQQATPPEDKAEQAGDLPGELTNDPYGAPPTGDSPSDAAALPSETEPKSDDPALPKPETGSDETYGDAFDDKPGYDPTADEVPAVPETPKHVGKSEKAGKMGKMGKSGKATKSLKVGGVASSEGKTTGKKKRGKAASSKANGKASTRYIDAMLLNVRSSPETKSPIIRRLLGGTKVSATISGEWAKIGANEWVRSKYLKTKPTKIVTEQDVAKAWEKSKYKDTWQPPQQ